MQIWRAIKAISRLSGNNTEQGRNLGVSWGGGGGSETFSAMERMKFYGVTGLAIVGAI